MQGDSEIWEIQKRIRGREEKRREETYFGGVEPDQIERVEIERRVRAIEDGPRAKLRGGQAGDYDAGELRVVATPVASDSMEEEKNERREQVELPRCSHCFCFFGQIRFLFVEELQVVIYTSKSKTVGELESLFLVIGPVSLSHGYN